MTKFFRLIYLELVPIDPNAFRSVIYHYDPAITIDRRVITREQYCVDTITNFHISRDNHAMIEIYWNVLTPKKSYIVLKTYKKNCFVFHTQRGVA